MNREPNPQKKSFKGSKRNVKNSSRSVEDAQERRFAGMSRLQFNNWLKFLPNEERYLALKVLCPQLVKKLLTLRLKQGDSWKLQMENQKPTTKFIKFFFNALQAFIDGLVLISDEDYLDSVGFDFSFVGCPDKLFDTLDILSQGWSKLKETKMPEEFMKFLTVEKSELFNQILRVIEKDYSIKSTMGWDSSILERQKNEKKQFGNFWKNLPRGQKINFLLQGYEDTKNLIIKELDELCSLTPSQLDQQISELINLDKKQICNKVFKCKIKKHSVDFCSYYQLIYKNWRQFATKKKTEGKSQKTKSKPTNKREKSLDQYSNDTNQTQKKETIVQINQEELYKALQEDILDCTDYISQASNKFYERRVLGFERISALFRLYNVNCKLFGSCSSGITIKESDIDIAINESILKMFQMEEDKKSQMGQAFQFMGQIFESLPWVTKVKVIKTAAIPIIKLTINTQIQVTQQFFTEEYRQLLNRSIENGGEVDADLTIQITQQQTSNHLGVISTAQINKWLEEIPTLRPIVILLKYQISTKSLNQTYTGGLNTYCLVVMIVSFIYHAKLQQETNVAVVFMKLLDFYGWRFNQQLYGIDLRDLNSIFYQKPKEEPSKFAELEVKDPLNNGKVMTRNCYAFEKIKQILRNIYNQCFVEKEKLMKEQYSQITKKLSKRKTKEESETESGSEKQRVKNFFLDLLV